MLWVLFDAGKKQFAGTHDTAVTAVGQARVYRSEAEAREDVKDRPGPWVPRQYEDFAPAPGSDAEAKQA